MHVSKIQFDFRRKKCCSKIFKGECIVCDQINKTRAYYLRTARSRYVKRLKTQRDNKEKKSSLYIAAEKRMELKRKHKKDNEHEKVKYSFKT